MLEHLAGGAEPRARRLTAVRHLAELFDRYALHRPDMVGAGFWSAGEIGPESGLAAVSCGGGCARASATSDPAERIAGACARIAAEPALLDLPPRLSVFGLTRLPAARLDVLRALAVARDVHLFLLHPSPVLWEAGGRARAWRGDHAARRSDGRAPAQPAARLVGAAMSSASSQLVLERAGEHEAHHPPASVPGPSLLAAIQAGARDDAPPPGEPLPGFADARPWPGPAGPERPHPRLPGRARQVEVLRDAVLHALAEDPTLELRDVI